MGETALKSTGKRKRGGQKGNQNARKHGFYSDTLSPSENREFLELTGTENLDPAVARIRVKLRTLLDYDPANRRALREASGLLAKHYTTGLGLDKADIRRLGVIIDTILEYCLSAPSSHPESSPGEMSILECCTPSPSPHPESSPGEN